MGSKRKEIANKIYTLGPAGAHNRELYTEPKRIRTSNQVP